MSEGASPMRAMPQRAPRCILEALPLDGKISRWRLISTHNRRGPITTYDEQQSTGYDPTCPESPTGAHHWVLGMPSRAVSAVCKHCNKEREFHPYEDQATRGYNGRSRSRLPQREDAEQAPSGTTSAQADAA